ncbi:stress protein DDR48-like [Tetranychus urticae]|uniref:Uncharacterized protein n=1 Tax=Tetranychus urticae TaxID=32264 RepID=T1KZ19_TETUR|nr:stress protein DDR48-like [Tetranychus urticae]
MHLSIVAFALLVTLTLTEARNDLKALETAYSSRYPLPPPEYEQSHGSYGKHDSSYGAHGHDDYGTHDKYGDHNSGSHGLKKYSKYGLNKADGAQSGAYGRNHGFGLYSRNRGYGYEKHYAYDKEFSTNKHGSDHATQSGHHGHHDEHGQHDLAAHGDYKNDRYGAHDKFGKHGHGKYGHNAGSYGNHGQNYKRLPKQHVSPYLGMYRGGYNAPSNYEAPIPYEASHEQPYRTYSDAPKSEPQSSKYY